MKRVIVSAIAIALFATSSYAIIKGKDARAESFQSDEIPVESVSETATANVGSENSNIKIIEVAPGYDIQVTEESLSGETQSYPRGAVTMAPPPMTTTTANNAEVPAQGALCNLSASFRDDRVMFNGEEISDDEFYFLSSVIEAESDGTDNLEGRIYIALTILNRVNDDRFPDTITGVLTQSGQFTTVVNGKSIKDATALSDQAIIEAIAWIEAGDAPNVLFFNCIGYNYGTPYGKYGDNYFMTLD